MKDIKPEETRYLLCNGTKTSWSEGNFNKEKDGYLNEKTEKC